MATLATQIKYNNNHHHHHNNNNNDNNKHNKHNTKINTNTNTNQQPTSNNQHPTSNNQQPATTNHNHNNNNNSKNNNNNKNSPNFWAMLQNPVFFTWVNKSTIIMSRHFDTKTCLQTLLMDNSAPQFRTKYLKCLGPTSRGWVKRFHYVPLVSIIFYLVSELQEVQLERKLHVPWLSCRVNDPLREKMASHGAPCTWNVGPWKWTKLGKVSNCRQNNEQCSVKF